MQGGEPWFVAVDVCEILELANSRDALRRLDEDEKMTVALTDSHSGQRGGAQFQTILNESGLYSLVMTSRKAEAKAFKKWVTNEVLPTIRKTGRYEVEAVDPAAFFAKAVIEAQKYIESQSATIAEQAQRIEYLEPKAEVLDSIAASDEVITVNAMAKILGYKPQGFSRWIKHQKFLNNNGTPRASMIDRGYMNYKTYRWEDGAGSTNSSFTAYFLPKSIPFVSRLAENYFNIVEPDCCMLKKSS